MAITGRRHFFLIVYTESQKPSVRDAETEWLRKVGVRRKKILSVKKQEKILKQCWIDIYRIERRRNSSLLYYPP